MPEFIPAFFFLTKSRTESLQFCPSFELLLHLWVNLQILESLMKILLLAVLSLLVWTNAYSQSIQREIKVDPPVCYASGKVERAYIPPPREFLLKSGEPKSDIIVEYSSNFPAQARTAIDYAVGIWESILESTVPIHVKAGWSSSLGVNTLASCGPETYYTNFKKAPIENRFYAVAIAEKIAGEELNGVSRSDINANFSSRVSWYYGTDGNTPDDKYDLVSVALHELAHGLGFTGFFFVQNDVGAYAYYEFGDASSFDIQVEQSSGNNLVDTSFFENASTQLKKALESLSLYFDSPVAISNTGERPRLFAPATFDEGSSVYHLNDAYYDRTQNALMTHAVGKAEAIHDPGPLTRGIMEDIGWTNLFLDFNHAKDREEPGPIDFVASIESYYPIDTSALMVIYSVDTFVTSDTLLFDATEKDGVFVSTLIPNARVTDIQYYITVADTMGRVRFAPSAAPNELLSVHIGPDSENPTIAHTAIPYFLLRGEPLSIQAKVDDNLGIDTVVVNYSINNIPQPSFGLKYISGIDYEGVFNFDLNSLKDGDVISYNIVATDASVAANQTVFPADSRLTFSVEKIFDPVTRFETNFNTASRDFLISDFSIYTAPNFQNGALHSPHPYLSPNVDNKDFNYTTILKHPIIIQQDGEISYEEVVLVEPGDLLAKYGDDNFWDYVIVEGSKDFGENWYELIDGYDSGANDIWYDNYNDSIVNQVSQAVGTSDWYAPRVFSLTQTGNFDVGDTILVRFRLYSDPYASGWGWAIDNLVIQRPLAAPLTQLSPDRLKVYPNPFENSFEVELAADQMIGEIRMDVYNSYGQKVWTTTKTNTSDLKQRIDLSGYGGGMYLLQVSEDGIPVFTKKMIKN